MHGNFNVTDNDIEKAITKINMETAFFVSSQLLKKLNKSRDNLSKMSSFNSSKLYLLLFIV